MSADLNAVLDVLAEPIAIGELFAEWSGGQLLSVALPGEHVALRYGILLGDDEVEFIAFCATPEDAIQALIDAGVPRKGA